MRTGAHLLLICALSFSTAAYAQVQPPVAVEEGALAEALPTTGTHVYTVAAIGDSLTDTRVGGGLYLGFLRQKCPESRFDAYGVGGQRTNHMRQRFLRDVFGVGASPHAARPRYTHVLVLGGVNDLSIASWSQAPIDDITRNISYMAQEAHQRGLQVIALTLPPWGELRGVRDRRAEATLLFNAWLHDALAQGALDTVVDIHDALTCGAQHVLCPGYRRFGNDFVHWNRDGHDVVGALVYEQAFADCR